ncbi:ATP-dependent RNA helicase Ded1p [Monosporozyma servazzii]
MGYVPPHLRGKTQSDVNVPDSSNNNISNNINNNSSRPSFGNNNTRGGSNDSGFFHRNDSNRGGKSFFSQNDSNGNGGGFFNRSNDNSSRGGFRGGSNRSQSTHSRWVDGEHRPAPRNERIETQLFGAHDGTPSQHSGINFDNYDDIPVDASGKDVPEPITEFTSPPLEPLLLENIILAHFTKPTPVQKYSIPIVTQGRDLMGCAQTGSGKTGGFLFPVLSEMFTTGPVQDNGDQPRSYYMKKGLPRCIILSPTRELTTQIFDEAVKFTYRSWVKPCVVYGGSPIGQQMREIDSGCDLLVATPGRLSDLLERGKISLRNVKYLILDEADRMLDMGFEPQIRHIVDECDMPKVDKRQNLMFSATFPADIQHLARDFLNDYIFLSVGRVGSTSENITQKILCVEDMDKKSALLDLLSTAQEGLTLIFVETKRMADQLTDFLIMQNMRATAIHGDRTQIERERALGAFKSGVADILVATAVAARGLDIPNVTLVINYDLPSDIDDYVHRIGRTGRAGNTGTAVSFFNGNNSNITRGLVDLLKEANQDVPTFLEDSLRFSSGGNNSRGGSNRGRRNDSTRDYRKSSGGSTWGNRSRGGGSGWGNSSTSWGNSDRQQGSSNGSWW